MRHFFSVIQTPSGTAVSGASIDVYAAGTTNHSTIYSDDGVTPVLNPLVSASDGTFGFYVADGRYDLKVSGTTLVTRTFSDVEIFDATEKNAADGTLTATAANFTTLTVTGTETVATLAVTGNETVGGTLQVTGATTLNSGTLNGTFGGNPTLSGNLQVNGTLGVTGISTLKQLGLVLYADQFAGADMGAKIQAAINTLPSGSGTNQGGIIDATSFSGDQTWASTLTLGVANQSIVLKLGTVRIISSANPIIKVPSSVSANIFGSGAIPGLASSNTGGTQFVNNGATNNAFDWFGSQGTLQNCSIVSSGAGVSLFVRALVASGRGAQQNFFQNISFSGPGSGVAGGVGIQLQSNSASELATENVFTGMNLIQFENAIKMTTTAAQGPTDNWFNGGSILGGSPGGTGINIVSGDINWFNGMIVAGCATGVLIGATATQNAFAVRLESNTTNINNAGIGSTFIPVNLDANTITDTGTNTVILGAAQAGILQKLGNGGGFQMNSPVGIGQPPQTGIALFVQPIGTLLNGTQVGAQFVPQTTSAATATGIGVRARADTAAAAFTQALNQGLRVDTPSVGAGSAITEWNGLFIDVGPTAGTKWAIKSAGTENYSLGGKVGVYNGITTVSNGVPSEVATVDSTGLTAAVGTTTLYAVPASGAGQYRLCWNAKITTAAGTSSTLGPLTITYTDPDGVVLSYVMAMLVNGSTSMTGPTTNTTSTFAIGLPLMLNCKASTNIQYAFAYASNAANAMAYNLHLKLEAL